MTMMLRMKKWMLVVLTFSLLLSPGWIAPPTVKAGTLQTLFEDDFEDGLAGGWTIVNGPADRYFVSSETSNVYKTTYSSSAPSEQIAVAGSASWTNYTVESKLKLYTEANNGGAAGLIARYVDADNFYHLRIHSRQDKVQLYKKLNGTMILLGEAGMTININQVYTLKLVVEGSQLTGYVDGVQKLSIADSALPAGKIGTRGYDTTYSIDDVTVTAEDLEPPAVPSNVTAAVYQNNVMVSWGVSADNVGTVGYAVYRNGSAIANVQATVFTDIGLTEGTYSYQVKAYDAAGNVSGLSSAASAVIGPSVLFSDDFEDGDAANWGGSGYSVAADGSTLVLKHTYASGGTTRYATAGNSSWSNYSVEMKLKSTNDNNSIAIYGRYRNADNHYALKLDTKNDLIVLSKKVGGTSTSLGSVPMTLQTNTFYTLKLEMNGSQLTGYVNGVQIVSAADTSINSGKIAFGGYSKHSYSADDVVVIDKRIPTALSVNVQQASMLVQENRTFRASIYDQSNLVMNDASPVWSSDNPAIASVDSTGKVTALAEGQTTIRATYGQLSAAIGITVEAVIVAAPIYGKHTLAPIEVDGVLDEAVWSLNTTARKLVTGESDNAVDFGTLWDESYFYIGIQVTDANVVNDSTESYDDDAVEIFIDGNHNHGSTYDKFDWQFRKGVGDTALYERLSETASVRHATAVIPGGYSVEFAIPWAHLGLTAAAGLDFGFDIAVNDDDNEGTREGQIVWSGIADNYKNTLAFGDWILSMDTVGTPVQPPAQPVGDRYVTPLGAGNRDGSSWANAIAGDQDGALTAAWAATGTANTLFIGSGTYMVPQTLNMASGGVGLQQMKKLVGIDTGGGLPVFQGDFTLSNQINRSLINVELGVDYWWVQDIVIRNYYNGIYANGRHEGVRIYNVSAHDISDGVYMWGRATRANPDAGSHDIIVKGGEYTNFTKSAVRFRNGNYRASVIGVTADAGGQANWTPGNFPMAFRVGNSPESEYIFDHDIVFQDSVGRNSWHQDDDNSYWNGDSFVAERQTYNLTYLRSKAFNNTDGGWDDKSRNPLYVDTIAFGNKRNYRIWSAEKATLVRAIGAYSYKRGGSGASLGLWAGGNATIEAYYSTFYNNQHQEIGLEDAEQVLVKQSIIGETNGSSLYAISGGQLTVSESEQFIQGVQGSDPMFVNGTNSTWDGSGNDFNSQLYGAAKGYHNPGPSISAYTVSISASSLTLDSYDSGAVTATVVDGSNVPVSDPESVIWYTDHADIARLLQSRGGEAIVQGVNAGSTELVALYKGAEARISITVN